MGGPSRPPRAYPPFMTDETRRHTVVALHGWFGWGQGWGADFPILLKGALGVDDDIHWVDYRGYGRRRDEPGAYTLDEIADDVLARLDGAGVERFSLLGHSMGGAAALAVAARAPERVRCLVGVSPVGASPTPFDEESRALFEGAPASDDCRAAIVDLMTGGRHDRAWIDAMVEASRAQSTRESFAAHLRAWAQADFAERVPRDLPALAVVGAHDPTLGEATVRQTWCELMPGTAVVVLAESGHYAMFEQPVALVDVIAPFLREH